MVPGVKDAFAVRRDHIGIASKLELDRPLVSGIHGPHARAIAITAAPELLRVEGF
jgi:hypothetical protein